MRPDILRLLIAFALALVIPLQGVAAVAGGICMSMGHHEAGAPSDTGHTHEGESAHDHGAVPADDEDSAHCGPCVACCAAATIAPATPAPILADSPAAAVAAPPFLSPGFLPDELDRPPLAL